MYKILKVEVIGIVPLIMHNGQTADPLNKYAKAMKEVSGKRKKTEADYEQLAKIEFMAGLYLDERGPVIPWPMIEATVLGGARKSKLGKLAQAGLIVDKNATLQYDGPRTADELWKNESYRLAAPVRIGQQKVIRTRPIFHKWSAELEISYLPDVINERDLLTAVRDAGAYAGFGDWRPRYGRYALAAELPAQIPLAA